MTNEEYSLLFHRAQVNLVAFKQVYHCDDELRKMVEMAVADERKRLEQAVEELAPVRDNPILQNKPAAFWIETFKQIVRGDV